MHILTKTNDLFGYEPLYDLTDENIEKIKSALNIPFVSFFGEEKYKTLSEKAAATLYLVSKNHDFGNGNKRTAVILTLLLLFENKKWINLTPEDLYSLSIDITADKTRKPDDIIEDIAKIFEANMKDFKASR